MSKTEEVRGDGVTSLRSDDAVVNGNLGVNENLDVETRHGRVSHSNRCCSLPATIALDPGLFTDYPPRFDGAVSCMKIPARNTTIAPAAAIHSDAPRP